MNLILRNAERYFKLKVFAPDWMKIKAINYGKIDIIPVQNPRNTFIEFHNIVNAEKKRPDHVVSLKASIDDTAILQDDGMKYAWNGNGITAMKHMGIVLIEDGVIIGPYTTIVRAVLDETTIRYGTCIGSHCNIGHNAFIGANTMIHPHVSIGGSASIGNNCYLGIGSMIRDHVVICDNVRIGIGAVVVKSINTPGTYIGNPAKRIGDYRKEF